MKQVTVYTDGSCNPNPGRGGFGAVLHYGEHRMELSGGFENTTNNRMELFAAIAALEAIRERPCRVRVFSDAQYVVKAVNKGWARRWREKGWRLSRQKKDVLNPDLWDRLLGLLDVHDVEFLWVRGHSGDPGNERADALAAAGAAGGNLEYDEGYDTQGEFRQSFRLI